jgi:dTDP-L-rhamnose 4-epimerase
VRVLLTGAAGFIGTAIHRALEADGHEVVLVDALLPQAHRVPPRIPDLHRLDVRDAGEWAPLLDGVDVVSHQAALVGAGTKVADLPAYAAHNDVGTAALLAAMADRGVRRLVLASSMVVYGEGTYACPADGAATPGQRPLAAMEAGDFDHRCPTCGEVLDWSLVEESTPPDPLSSYAAGKVAQEHYTSAWARQADAAAVALRYHNVYGPGMPRDTPYSGVAAIFRSSLERGEPPQVFEDGAQMRDFVHVDDVARANVLALEAVVAREPGSMAAYNVCSGVPVSILEVARILARELTTQPVVTRQFRPGDVRHVVASPARATSELGFTAEIGPQQGLAGFATAPLRG